MDFDYEKKFEVDGLTFRMRVVRDPFMGEPWKEHDGHGIVSDWTARPKAAGELVLNTDGESHRFYDLAETLVIAKRDKWGLPPEEAKGKTKKQITFEAVMQDYRRMKAWCDDEWWWVIVRVELLDVDGKPINREGCWESLGGIESDSPEYHLEVAKDDLAPEIAERFKGKDEVCVRIRKPTPQPKAEAEEVEEITAEGFEAIVQDGICNYIDSQGGTAEQWRPVVEGYLRPQYRIVG